MAGWDDFEGSPLSPHSLRSRACWTKVIGAKLLHRSFSFFVTMLTLFFLFRDGEWLGARLLVDVERGLGDPGEISEGLLIGAGYVLAGVPEPALFAVLTMAFAMLPFGAWFAFRGCRRHPARDRGR